MSQKKPAYGRRVAQWTPVELGVHKVIDAGPMPAYVRRPHDELLRAVLDPAVPASRLVVVRGGSSTGKTRAAYEAVAGRLAGWRLDYPLNPAALKERLDAGIPARTVLWLGELRQYADADGGAEVLGRLADLIVGEGRLLITTVWPEQWNAYTAAARPGLKTGPADPAGTAGRLLEPLPELTGRDPAAIDPARGGVIDIPPRFTAADLEAVARTGDPVLAKTAAAAASAGQDGQVTQYLAGVPDLLDRYEGSGGDPYGQAVLTAAMDAVRLGHASPLPAALIQEAAVGYLTGPQRTTSIESWRDTALAWAAEELKGAVRALQPVPPPSGTGVAGYQVADYLDQYGRRTRQDQLGPPSLWDALTARTVSASDLTRLGQAAQDRGLYRHAAALWTRAATLGSTNAARQLITHLRRVSPGDTTRAAQWAAGHASLDNPWGVAVLLRALGAAGASDAVTALAARAAGPRQPRRPVVRRRAAAGAGRGRGQRRGHRPAGPRPRRARQPRPPGGRRRAAVGAGRGRGRRRGHRPAGPRPRRARQPRPPGGRRRAAAGAARGRGQRRGHRPGRPGRRARQPRRPVGRRRAAAGAGRGRGQQRGHHPAGPRPRRARQPRPPGGRRRAAAGAGRGRGQRRGHDPAGPRPRRARQPRRPGGRRRAAVGAARGRGQRRGHCPGRPGRRARQPRRPVGVAELLRRWARPGPATRSLPWPPGPPGTPAPTTRGTSPSCCRRWARPGPATRSPTLLARDPAGHASPDDPGDVAELLSALREAGASNAVTTLLARDPAGHASPDNPGDVAELLSALREAGASNAVTALAARAANAGMFGLFLEVHPDEASSYLSGREPDGAPSQSWKWQEP